MSCNCTIDINYIIDNRGTFSRTITDLDIAGSENGYSYYLWAEDFGDATVYDIKLFWNVVTSRWEIRYADFLELELPIAYLDTVNACPVDDIEEWIVTDVDEAWLEVVTTSSNCPEGEETITDAEKTLIIQHLQCRHKTWLVAFDNALSLGKCVEKNHLDNIMVTNLIDVVYRYVPSTEDVPLAINCITEDQLCDIICKVRNLTTECNC